MHKTDSNRVQFQPNPNLISQAEIDCQKHTAGPNACLTGWLKQLLTLNQVQLIDLQSKLIAAPCISLYSLLQNEIAQPLIQWTSEPKFLHVTEIAACRGRCRAGIYKQCPAFFRTLCTCSELAIHGSCANINTQANGERGSGIGDQNSAACPSGSVTSGPHRSDLQANENPSSQARAYFEPLCGLNRILRACKLKASIHHGHPVDNCRAKPPMPMSQVRPTQSSKQNRRKDTNHASKSAHSALTNGRTAEMTPWMEPMMDRHRIFPQLDTKIHGEPTVLLML